MTEQSEDRKRTLDAMRRSVALAYREDVDAAQLPADEVFRFAMVRKIRTFLRDPQRCRETICRRSKRCMGPTMRCARDIPAPKSSPEEDAAAIAKVSIALQARLAELGRK